MCQVSATDADEGSNGRIVYSFVTAQQNFILNSSSGEIYTSGSLDHEVQSEFHVSILFIMYIHDITWLLLYSLVLELKIKVLYP